MKPEYGGCKDHKQKPMYRCGMMWGTVGQPYVFDAAMRRQACGQEDDTEKHSTAKCLGPSWNAGQDMQ